MNYAVRVLRRADADLFAIEAYLAREAPDAADRVLDALFDAIDALAEMPERHPEARDQRVRSQGFRVAVVLPYLIFFKVGKTQVRVHRVVHGKRAYRGLF